MLCQPFSQNYWTNTYKNYWTLRLTAHGLRQDASLVRACGFFESDGYETMQAWIKQGKLPTAIFAANDPAAIGALRALLEADIRVPQEVALVGAGNIHYGDLLSVPLTTITWDKTEMGQASARLLFSLLAQEKNKARPDHTVTHLLEPALIVRKSCGAA